MSFEKFNVDELNEVKSSLELLFASNNEKINTWKSELSTLETQMKSFQERINEINELIEANSRNNYLIEMILPTFKE